MKISELSRTLQSSVMTIRRDLDWLEENGIVKRYRGGVELTKSDINQPSFYERIEEFSNEKYLIGKQAADLIRTGNIVFFDAGTTPLAVVDHIPDELEFTAVTTGLLTATALCAKPLANVVCVGGGIHHSSFSSMGRMAAELIRSFHADLAFISTKSIVLPDGTYEAQLPLIEIKQAIVQSSDRVVLLADNNKFESKSMCKAITLESIDTIISDYGLNPECAAQLKSLGKTIIIAK